MPLLCWPDQYPFWGSPFHPAVLSSRSTITSFGTHEILSVPGRGHDRDLDTRHNPESTRPRHFTGRRYDPDPPAFGRPLTRGPRHEPFFAAARLEAEELQARVPQVSSLPDPTASLTYQPAPVVTARGPQRSQWRVQQTIPFPGKLRLRGEIAHLGAEVAGAEANVFAHDLTLQIKLTYHELFRIQEQGGIIRRFQEELRQFEEVAATRYEVGTGMLQDILKAQLERNALNIRLEKLDEEERTNLEILARLLNRPDLSGLDRPVVVRAPVTETEQQNLLELALAARPEADAVRFDLERADRKDELARREFLPDFTFSLNYFDISDSELTPTMTGRDALALEVGVKIPLWQGRLRGDLQEARAHRRQAEARQEALVTSFRTQIEDLTHRRERQQRQLQLLDESLLPQAKMSLEATLSAYTTDRTAFLDLLDAERTLFTLRLEWVDTYARYLKTAAALERALGTGSLDKLTR